MQTQEAPVREAVPEQHEAKHRNWTSWLLATALLLGVIAVALAR
jgi:hypothetical protein